MGLRWVTILARRKRKSSRKGFFVKENATMSEEQADYITEAQEMIGRGYRAGHPGLGQNCSTCFYIQNIRDETTGEPKAECRRHAPQMLSGSGSGWSNQLWPYVKPTDWCGEWSG
jgi:hypothetical protein